MNVKIQGGGGGKYANTGSSIGSTNYLEHEDEKRQAQGKSIEPFFNDKGIFEPKEVSYKIDHNKGRLMNKDDKFYVITISPSEAEIKAMGKTEQEQSANFKDYIVNGVMEQYAKNFDKENKVLKAENLLYFAKIHHERGDKQGEQMHAHILVSRLDNTQKIRLCPQTAYKERKGKVSGFNRDKFFDQCEKSFDKGMNFERELENTYKFQKAVAMGDLGTVAEMRDRAEQMKREADILKLEQVRREALIQAKEQRDKAFAKPQQEQQRVQEQKQEQKREQDKPKGKDFEIGF